MATVPRPRKAAATKPDTEPDTSGTTGTSDSGEPQAPPRTPTRRNPADIKLRESVKGMYEGVALLAFGIGMQRGHEPLRQFASTLMEPSPPRVVVGADGNAVVLPDSDPRTGADKIADAWMTAAERNPRIKDALRKVTEGGAIAEVAALHVALILPFLPGIPGLAFLSPTRADNGAPPA